MMTTATERNGTGKYTFRCGSPEIAAERLGRKLRVQMIRVTGDRGLSGMFQGYRSIGNGGLTSQGGNWHIS